MADGIELQASIDVAPLLSGFDSMVSATTDAASKMSSSMQATAEATQTSSVDMSSAVQAASTEIQSAFGSFVKAPTEVRNAFMFLTSETAKFPAAAGAVVDALNIIDTAATAATGSVTRAGTAVQASMAQMSNAAAASEAGVGASLNAQRGLWDGLTRTVAVDSAQMDLFMDSVAQTTATGAVQMSAAMTGAAESSTTSTNVISAAWERLQGIFRGVVASIGASLSEVKEMFASTAESAQVATGGISGSFAGLAGLLGVGIFVHAVDDVADFNIELDHLSEKTGIAVEKLAGLHLIAKENAISWEPVAQGLIRVQRAQQLAADGGQQQINAFQRLGLSVKEITALSPEKLFERVSQAMKETSNHQAVITSGFTLLGRGGQEAIPIMQEYGGSILKAGEEAGKLTGITDDSATSARNWKRQVEELSATFKSILIPVMQAVTPVVKIIWNAFEALAGAILIVGDAVGAVLVSMVKGLGALGTLLKDVFEGNWSKLATDAANIKNVVVNEFSEAGKSIKKTWQSTIGDITSQWKSMPPIKPTIDDSGAKGKGDPTEQLKVWQQQLQAMKDKQGVFYEESAHDEQAFWASKLEAAHSNSELYAEVYHLMMEAARAATKQDLKEDIESMRQKVAATKQGSLERLTILNEELAYLKSIGAQKTEEYKAIERAATQAQLEFDQQQKKSALDKEMVKVAAAKSGSAEQVRLITEALALAKTLYGEDSDEYRRVEKEKERAELEFFAKKRQIQTEEIDADKNHQESLLNQERARVEAEYEVGAMSVSQHLALLTSIENQEYEITRSALERKQALYAHDEEEWSKIQKQIEEASDKHNETLNEIDLKGWQERRKNMQAYLADLEQGFSSTIEGMLKGTETFKKGMEDLWNSLVSTFIQSMMKTLVAHLQIELMKTLGTEQQTAARTAVQKAGDQTVAAAHSASNATQAASDTAKTTTEIAQTTSVTAQKASADVTQTTSHVASNATQMASDTTKTATETAQTTAITAKKVSSDVAQTASHVSANTAQTVSDTAKNLKEVTQTTATTAMKVTAETTRTTAHLTANTVQSASDTVKTTAEVAKTTAVTATKVTADATQTAAHVAANSAQVASDATAAAASTGISFTSHMKKLAHSAVVAAGKAYEAFADIPIIGPVLGAAAAAVTFAAVMAFGSLMGAEKGAYLEKDQPIFAHKGEMILPPPISAGFQSVFKVLKTLTTPVVPQMALAVPGGGGGLASGPSSSTVNNANKTFIDSRSSQSSTSNQTSNHFTYSPTNNHPTAPAADMREYTRAMTKWANRRTGIGNT